MFRNILVLLAAILVSTQAWSAPSYEGTDSSPGQKPPDRIWHKFTFDSSTSQSRAFSLGASCSVKFTKVGSGNVVLYEVPLSTSDYTDGVAETTFTASTSQAYTFAPGSSFGMVRAAADSSGSIVEVLCLNTGTFSGGGGGVVLVSESSLPATGDSSKTYRITDATDSTDCAAGTPGTAIADCRWNGTSYEAIGIAATGLTNPLTATLDADTNDITNVGDLSAAGSITAGDTGDGTRGVNLLQNGSALDEPASSRGKVGFIGRWLYKRVNGESAVQIDETNSTGGKEYAPPAMTETVTSGTSRGRIDREFWMTPDGSKSVCTDTTPNDGLCDSDTTERAGKTTISAITDNVYHLTQTEGYWREANLYCGGDTDCIGLFMRTFSTGGSQDSGDEGTQGIRGAIYDHWGTAVGTIGTAIPSGASTTTVSISGVPEYEAKMMGENKLMIFTSTITAVDIVTAAPGTINASETVAAGTWGAGSGGTWTLGAGEGALVASTGYCFRPNLSTFTGYFNTSPDMEVWLPITAVSTDTITTQWLSQAVDYRVPYGTLAAVGTDTGAIAACGFLKEAVLASDRSVSSIPVKVGAGFPGVASSSAFAVHPYPGTTLLDGSTARVGRMFGSPGASLGNGHMSMASIGGGIGRYQLGAAFKATYNLQTGTIESELKDGKSHVWKTGMDCSQSGTCERGVAYTYRDIAGLAQWFAELDMGNTDFGTNDNPSVVIRVLDAGVSNAGNTSLNMTVDKTSAWGQNNDPFITAARTQTISGAKTVTGSYDFGGGVLEIPNGTTPPATCNVGQYFHETDRTSGQRTLACEAANTWVLQGDGGSGGSVATDTIWAALGDIVIGTGASTAARLPVGSASQVLTVGGGVPGWQSNPGGVGAGLIAALTQKTAIVSGDHIMIEDSEASNAKKRATARNISKGGHPTQTECTTLYAPVDTISGSDDIQSFYRAPIAITITEVWCETDTGTADLDLQVDDGTPADVIGTDLTCTSGGTASSPLTVAMADGDRLDLALTNTASAPTRLTVCAEYVYQ